MLCADINQWIFCSNRLGCLGSLFPKKNMPIFLNPIFLFYFIITNYYFQIKKKSEFLETVNFEKKTTIFNEHPVYYKNCIILFFINHSL